MFRWKQCEGAEVDVGKMGRKKLKWDRREEGR